MRRGCDLRMQQRPAPSKPAAHRHCANSTPLLHVHVPVSLPVGGAGCGPLSRHVPQAPAPQRLVSLPHPILIKNSPPALQFARRSAAGHPDVFPANLSRRWPVR